MQPSAMHSHQANLTRAWIVQAIRQQSYLHAEPRDKYGSNSVYFMKRSDNRAVWIAANGNKTYSK